MPISKQVFAAAVAHGLDPRVVATWHPDIPRTPRVLVPMQVDALVVRAEGGVWADCRMRNADPAHAGDIDASTLLPEPFANLPAPRAPGVYLHWALPDALTRGVGSLPPDDATDAERAAAGAAFPAIPDRWLVMRIGGGTSRSRRGVQGWVIESGAIEPVVTEVDRWREPGPPAAGATPRKPLTALGNGDPAWSAYYDNVENRLGFRDRLEGITEGPLGYLVCGWYSDPALDVLGDSITSVAQFENRIHELGWELPPGSYGYVRKAFDRIHSSSLVGLETREATRVPGGVARTERRVNEASANVRDAVEFEGSAHATPVDRFGEPAGGYFASADQWWPRYILCHGGVVGIGWPGVGIPGSPRGLLGGEVGGPPSAENVRVAIGHTVTDALAALFAANNHTPDQARALETALLGTAADLDEPDAAAKVDLRVHAASFGSLPGGFVTETIMQTPPSPPPAAHQPDPAKTDFGIFKDKRPQGGGGKFGGGKLEGVASTFNSVAVAASSNTKIGGVKVHPDVRMTELIAASGQKGPQAVAARVDAEPQPVTVKRAQPRFFIPPDPVILLQGVNRSFKHGGDGRFSEKGKLPCRVSGMRIEELASVATADLPRGGAFRGQDVLERGVANGSVPPECDDLLFELGILDPGSATFGARATARTDRRLETEVVARASRAYAVEQTIWWASRDPRRDMAPLAAQSGFSGVLPCAIAVSPPLQPWVPLHLDWEIEYLAQDSLDTWSLGEVDFDAKASSIPPADALPAGIVLQGRALLTAGAAQIAAATVRQTLDRAQRSGGSTSLRPGTVEQFHSLMAKTLLTEISGMTAAGHASNQDAELKSIADALADMDVLAGALDRFHTRLRGGYVADGAAAPADGQPKPAPFVALRAGFMRIRRLRLVDCFGQVVDLAGSGPAASVDMTRVVRSEPMTVAERADLLELAPRFTAPARLMFRFAAADDDATEADGTRSPLCGFLLPDHLDAELQFHAADGDGLGAVRFDADAGIQWEDAPGKPTTIGAIPARAVSNPHLAGVAQGLLDWGIADTTLNDPDKDTALSALLRVIDTALWTVDPFGHTGDEHLSLLVGHPVAVMRARLTLEVEETIDAAELQLHLVPVRIGALAHWQDGLLGYYVDDDYRRLNIPDPVTAGFARPLGPGQGFLQQATQTTSYYEHFAEDIGLNAVEGASPVRHDFVDPSGVIWMRPGQTVRLTLLVEPMSAVHVTSGLLPRKSIGMRREWVNDGLSHIAPTFRFGPVLVDPKRIRMPLASEIHGAWSWCHRVDATTWQEDAVVNSTGDAQLPRDPVEGQEGWLKLSPEAPPSGAGS